MAHLPSRTPGVDGVANLPPRQRLHMVEQLRDLLHKPAPLRRAYGMEVHHHDGNHANNAFDNLRLLHGHCHDVVHGSRC